MNQSLSNDEFVQLTLKVAALYVREYPRKTLGEWVLGKFYPDIDQYALVNARDFMGADRTHDGRMYLGGMLRTGSLDAEPLLRAVEGAEFGEDELRWLI